MRTGEGSSCGLWFADEGEGVPLVALHPGGTDSRALGPLVGALGPGYRVIMPERRGHGRTPDCDGEWHFSDMAADTASLLDELRVSRAHIVGWSDGAIVGLHLALARPDLVASLVFGGAAFQVNGWRDGVLAGEPPAFMADAYAELSPDGIGHWPDVVGKLDRLHQTEPDISLEQLRTLSTPTLIVMGDDDEVRLDHVTSMYDSLPHGELAIVPRATHGLIVEKPDLLARLIRDFHDPGKSDGLAPIRRTGIPGPNDADRS